ncbi:hypothetical protein LV84_04298 [Algoriphagus ratkowskyi]|uniref:Uncharacterized protein n=1 Tax=Algoriphagus ratkowskyi TaxID=57028 RepID=A0A2W7QLM4_9BACT|nr:hypothetical protein LV84_04298 [Algoriphagus ratkowskyi]
MGNYNFMESKRIREAFNELNGSAKELSIKIYNILIIDKLQK